MLRVQNITVLYLFIWPYSDIQSEEDSPKKSPGVLGASEDSARETKNKEAITKSENEVRRPIYMRSPKKLPIPVTKTSASANITNVTVYDMPDALEEPRKRPISKKRNAKSKAQAEKKPTRKRYKKERPGKLNNK